MLRPALSTDQGSANGRTGPRCHCPATWVMVGFHCKPRQGTEAESTDRIRFRISISHHIDHTEYFVLCSFSAFFFGLGFKLGWIFVRASQRVGRVALPLLVLWLAGPPCRTMQARSDRYNNAGGSRYASVLLWRYCNSTFYICVCVCVCGGDGKGCENGIDLLRMKGLNHLASEIDPPI